MIITSLLDQDFYKFTMMNVVYHRFTSTTATFKYKLRNTNILFTDQMVDMVRYEIHELCKLTFKVNEITYLRSLGLFKEDFLEFLGMFRLREEHIHLSCKDGKLDIEIEGSWLYIMLFEIYLMSIISEVYFHCIGILSEHTYNIGMDKLNAKIDIIEQYNKQCNNTPLFKFADFGGRRRLSKKWHKTVVGYLKSNIGNNLAGTSNVMLAKEYNLTPIGTMAHEYLQAWQALGCRLIDSQKEALQAWCDEYRGSLGIALSDVITTDAFLRDFDLYFAKLFDGCRHDSGDPEIWCNKLIKHYEKMGIDPYTKTAIFSDGLTIEKAIKLFDMFRNKINISFGIGTSLTNDVGIKPLNHVIKMVKCNDQDVAKISDEPKKSMCTNESYISYLKEVFKV